MKKIRTIKRKIFYLSFVAIVAVYMMPLVITFTNSFMGSREVENN